MAIFSLRHTPIGRSTQAQPYTAGAHVKYITRPQAARHVMAERMPVKPGPAASYLKQMENADRVNARVADKVMLALPKELTREQRVQLVRDFANDVTRNKAPWLAAIHDRGKDARNPHCHLLIRDRDPATGKRVIGMSDVGSTEMLREKWERHANRALARAGHSVQIDRRSLKDQGVDRAPTIHEGPNVRAMEARGAKPRSKTRTLRNGPGARRPSRRIDYRAIDRGRTRPAYNRSVRAAETEADYWDAIDRDQQRREFTARGLGSDYARWERQADRQKPANLAERLRSSGASRRNKTNADAMEPYKRKSGERSIAPSASGNSKRSMDGVGRFDFEAAQEKKVVHPLRDRLPLQVPAALPTGPGAIDASERAFKPTAQRVARVQGEDDLSHQLGVRPMGAASRGKRPEGRNTEDHDSSMGQQRQFARGQSMSDEDDRIRQRHEQQLDNARIDADQSRGRFDDLMKRSYLDPKSAEKRMEQYRADHGDQALYNKLDGNARENAFGRRPGSIASPQGYAPGAGDLRRDSLIARPQLSDATRKMIADRERQQGAEQTLKNTGTPEQAAQPAPTASPSLTAPRHDANPEVRQAYQHKGLERSGQPPAKSNHAPAPDWSRMNPEARQANQHRGLERPQKHNAEPQMAPAPRSAPPHREIPSPDVRQANQHKGLERPGQPRAAGAAKAPEPNWQRMSPEARQAKQHRQMERPRPPGPASAPPPAGMAGQAMRNNHALPGKPVMAPAPQPTAAKSSSPTPRRKPEMEM